MAIYHFSTKVISRSTGRTAVGAAAYINCSAMTSEYDGVHHDYTRKAGLGYAQVFIPDNAPREWLNREKLWNAVEQAETAKDSRLARQFTLTGLVDGQYRLQEISPPSGHALRILPQ